MGLFSEEPDFQQGGTALDKDRIIDLLTRVLLFLVRTAPTDEEAAHRRRLLLEDE